MRLNSRDPNLHTFLLTFCASMVCHAMPALVIHDTGPTRGWHSLAMLPPSPALYIARLGVPVGCQWHVATRTSPSGTHPWPHNSTKGPVGVEYRHRRTCSRLAGSHPPPAACPDRDILVECWAQESRTCGVEQDFQQQDRHVREGWAGSFIDGQTVSH